MKTDTKSGMILNYRSQTYQGPSEKNVKKYG